MGQQRFHIQQQFSGRQGVANPLVYAVVSPGLNGSMETSCAYILANRRGLGDDYVQVTAPSQTSSKQFKSAVGTYAELTAMPGEEGDIRLVLETNKLYSYVGGAWQPVDASKFNDDSAANGAGAIAYTTGKVTVADFQAASATITGALSGSAATFTSSVTANSFIGNGAALTDLNASNVNSGVLGAAFGGTGVDSSAAAQGSLLIGTGAGFALGAISAGDGIGVLNGAGSITISNTGVLSITGTNNQVIASAMNGDVVLSLPQDIATTSTPTFAGAMFNGNIDVASISQAGVPATLAFQYASDTGSTFYAEPNLGLGTGALAGRKNAGNVAIGMDVLGRMTTLGYYDESGTWNTGVGYQALYSNDYGDENTAVGYKSLYSNTTGYYNTAMGSQSMLSNTTGTANTAIGYDAMRMNTTGSGNTSLGVASLHNNTTGYRNVALGRGAMYYNTTGYRNAMVGQAALHYNTEGHQNAGVGQASIYLNTTGYYNASVGAYGLYFNTTGAENSSVGANSLLGNVNGNRNSALGYQANVLSGALNYASAIGADSRVGTSDTVVLGALGVNKNSTYSTIDDQIVIGSTARNDTFPNTKLYVEGNVNLNGDLYAANATFSGAVNFQGGVLVPTDQKLRFGEDFENSDSQFIYRSNLADDQTVMRVVIGDNPNTFGHPQADEFQIGRLEDDQLTYTPVFRVAGNGDVIASGTVSATRLLLSDSSGGIDEPNVIIGVGAMAGAASGGGANTAIGINALNQNTSGFKNIAVGNIALFNNTVGNKNTGVGYGALFGNTTGSNNTAVGDGVAYSMTTGDRNTALGQIAMFSNTSGEENTAIGQAAMYSNITGYMNTVVGQAALFYNTVGYQNTAIGAQALFANTTGRDNTAIGSLSLLNNTTGISNTAVGDSSLYFNTTGEKNAALGDNSLRSNTTGFRNVAIGQSSLRGNTTGSRNVALGDDAGYANSAFDNTNANISGSNNTFLGANALPGVATQLNYATALGSDALVTTSNTIALGRITDTTVIGAAGAATSGLLLDKAFQVTGDIGVTGNFEIGGTFTAPSAIFAGSVTSSRLNVGTLDGVSSTNTIIGLNAIEGVQSGLGSNVAVGESAMRYNTTGAYNTAVGAYALFQNSAGGGNTTLGAFAGAYMDSSSLVTAIGDHAAVSADGSESVAIGAYALSQFLGLYHVSVGNNSLGSLTTGNANTALGHYAMPSLASGDTNIAIGHRSGNTITTGSRNILIGDLAGDGTLTSNNNIALGNSATIGDALSYAVTIGNDSSVTTSNTVVLGRTIDNIVMGATGDDGSGNKLQVTGGLRASGNVFLNTGTAANYTQLRDLRVMSSVDDAGWDHLRIYTRGRKTSIDAGGAEDGLVFRVGQGGSGGVGDQTYNTVLTLKPDQSAVFTGRVDVQSLYVNGEQIAPVNKANIDTALTFASTVGAAYPQSSLALGVNALDADPRAGNIAIGEGVLTSLSPSAINTEGIFNTGVGFNALTLNSTGSNNTAVGTYSLNRNTTGYANTAIGVYAMVNTTTGYDNTGVGVNALNANTTGNRNNALGVNALFSNSSGAQNNALGTNSLFSNTTGYQNVAVGDNALYTNSAGYQNVAVGPDALYNNTTGYYNIAVGRNALLTNSTGYNNSALGYNSLIFNTTGYNNSALGRNALQNNTTGLNNTALGTFSMFGSTTGLDNTSVGFNTLYSNTTGNANLALGKNALFGNATGSYNMGIGTSTDVLQNNLNYASALGAFARVTTSNTLVLGALGVGKDGVVSSTDDQVVIGTTARNDTISNTIFHVAGVSNFSSMLYATGGAQISTNHSLHFGPDSESTDRLSIYRFNPAFDQSILRISIGDNIKTFGEATGDELQVGRLNPDNSFNPVFRVAGNGDVIASGYMQATAFNVSSDRRLKTNIQAQDSGSVLGRLEQLQTYSYEYLANPNLGRRIGVIAQEIQSLFPEAVATRADGMMSVDYSALGAMAAMGVGQLSKQVKVLDKTVADQGQRITVLDEQINQHDTRITSLESWRSDASKRMDGMQTAIDLNIQKIAENAVAIQTNSVAIERLDDALFTLDGQVKNNSDLINNINSRWAKNFSESADGSLLTVNAVELKVSNFTAQQLRANSVYSQRLEAEMARITDLEVNNLKANSAVANTVQAEQVNTGSAQVYAGVGLPAVLFAAKSDGHYTVSTSALDGSYATATVIVNAGQAKVVSVASEGIELYAEGNQVKVIAAGKSIKASWIKMG